MHLCLDRVSPLDPLRRPMEQDELVRVFAFVVVESVLFSSLFSFTSLVHSFLKCVKIQKIQITASDKDPL